MLLVLVATTTLLAAGVAFTQAVEGEDAPTYIVVLEDGVDSPSRVADGIEGRQEGLEVGFVYSAALEGFSAEIPAESLDDVRNNRSVAYVERDKVVRKLEQALPWGIERVDAPNSTADPGTGPVTVTGVRVYVLDTGIDADHADLNVVRHLNFHGGPNTDCDGHGTHVAGTLAAEDNDGDVVGVAPGAPLTGVKVLDCTGHGTVSKVIKGVDWVTRHTKGPDGAAGTADDRTPAVANMSIGGDISRALDRAVRRSVDGGVFYSISAGNDGRSACKRSPARAGVGRNNGIVTTAATNRLDQEAAWSSYGRCVDLWAPGVGIESTRLGGGTKPDSGTSMSAPHVGGTAALYLAANPADSAVETETALVANSEPTSTKSKNGAEIRLVDAGDEMSPTP